MKRKPDQVVVHRIEFQAKERELIESLITINGATSIINSISSIDVKTLYALLTLLEATGLINTPIPTLGEHSEILNGLKTFSNAIRGRYNEGTKGAQIQEEADDAVNTLAKQIEAWFISIFV